LASKSFSHFYKITLIIRTLGALALWANIKENDSPSLEESTVDKERIRPSEWILLHCLLEERINVIINTVGK